MNDIIEELLKVKAIELYKGSDSAHDIQHAYRVLMNVKTIMTCDGGDLDILVPAALFHDVVCYPKDSEYTSVSAEKSARVTRDILLAIKEYPKDKIPKVLEAIYECSYTKGIEPDNLESRILQDADRIEATGAVAIMRTFASAGQMGTKLYHNEDPFCEERKPEPKLYAVDLFYSRLFKVKKGLHTRTAKKIAEKNEIVMIQFIEGLKRELML